MGKDRRPSIFFDLAEFSLAGGTDNFELRARCRFHGIEHGVAERLEFPLEKECLAKQMEAMRERLRRMLDELM